MNKNAAESHRILVEVYGEHSLADQTCPKSCERFESGDFDSDDKERPGQPKKIEDEKLEDLLEENLCQTHQELSLEVDLSTVRKHILQMLPLRITTFFNQWHMVYEEKN